MKLFQVDYMEGRNEEVYLTVGEDSETEETIKKREFEKKSFWSCPYFMIVKEITEVDGHKITVE